MQENIQLKNHFNKLMLEMPLIAILRGITSKDIRQVTDILIDAGFKMIEVPLNSPDPFKTIEILRNHCDSDILVGAGTVINSADLKILDNIGAELIVTPNLDTNILSSLKDYNNFISLIGCFSPSECFQAIKLGADAIKIFPADSLGTGYIKNIKAVLPKDKQVLAVGGISVDNMQGFINMNVNGFGLGSALYSPDKTFLEIKESAHRFISQFNKLKA